ncbi:filamentation induced by cAMP protein fic [Mycobacteroides abscessus subsp. abscessus]|uniref:Fic/DOC family protein n=1 Tax=Mycobacteroides abscessus TaxID=36809 RepID=UPI0009A74614|nr:Fic family protein [Mycobacteroides abscessus]SLI00821.1 filamentation induced by cAMP protein fic [Mycobacteroides abscessus subsp. abscessus]
MASITVWEDYFIPGTKVLANKIGATTAEELELYEAVHSGNRIAAMLAGTPPRRFDYTGFQQVHRDIFQDVYEWAGEPRTTPPGRMTKEYRNVVHYPLDDLDAPLMTYGYYQGPAVAAAAHQRFAVLAAEDELKGLQRDQFIDRLAEHWAEINTVHSFREGNTRAQTVFFALLAAAAGHPLRTRDLLHNGPLREAFIAARFYAQMTVDYSPLASTLAHIVQ